MVRVEGLAESSTTAILDLPATRFVPADLVKEFDPDGTQMIIGRLFGLSIEGIETGGVSIRADARTLGELLDLENPLPSFNSWDLIRVEETEGNLHVGLDRAHLYVKEGERPRFVLLGFDEQKSSEWID